MRRQTAQTDNRLLACGGDLKGPYTQKEVTEAVEEMLYLMQSYVISKGSYCEMSGALYTKVCIVLERLGAYGVTLEPAAKKEGA